MNILTNKMTTSKITNETKHKMTSNNQMLIIIQISNVMNIISNKMTISI